MAIRWIKSTVSSVWGLVGLRGASPAITTAERMEEIRDTMLCTLGSQGQEISPGLTRRLQFASDIESLWYLRSDWMGTLAATLGERAAKHHVDRVNVMFDGLLPAGLQSRPRSLLH